MGTIMRSTRGTFLNVDLTNHAKSKCDVFHKLHCEFTIIAVYCYSWMGSVNVLLLHCNIYISFKFLYIKCTKSVVLFFNNILINITIKYKNVRTKKKEVFLYIWFSNNIHWYPLILIFQQYIWFSNNIYVKIYTMLIFLNKYSRTNIHF